MKVVQSIAVSIKKIAQQSVNLTGGILQRFWTFYYAPSRVHAPPTGMERQQLSGFGILMIK